MHLLVRALPDEGVRLVTGSGVFDVRQLDSSEAGQYRELRLLALRANPEAFGSSFEEEAAFEDDVFAERLSKGRIFGAWLGKDLVGSAGLALRDKKKLRHKGVLWGMFVRPDCRGRGAARQLLSAVLADARTSCEEVLLTVVEGNDAAYGLYVAAGFVEYGREPAAIKIGTNYHHELLMRLPLAS